MKKLSPYTLFLFHDFINPKWLTLKQTNLNEKSQVQYMFSQLQSHLSIRFSSDFLFQMPTAPIVIPAHNPKDQAKADDSIPAPESSSDEYESP